MRKEPPLGVRLLILAGCALVIFVRLLYDAPCPIRAVTGVICPSCGMSRAVLAALRLDFAAAFYYHPMFWAVPPVILMFLFPPKRWYWWVAAGLTVYLVCYGFRLAAFLRGGLMI